MRNNLQYLIKWCHAMGYSIRIGLNIVSITHKNKRKIVNIKNINNMSVREMTFKIQEIKKYMEEKINEKR